MRRCPRACVAVWPEMSLLPACVALFVLVSAVAFGAPCGLVCVCVSEKLRQSSYTSSCILWPFNSGHYWHFCSKKKKVGLEVLAELMKFTATWQSLDKPTDRVKRALSSLFKDTLFVVPTKVWGSELPDHTPHIFSITQAVA